MRIKIEDAVENPCRPRIALATLLTPDMAIAIERKSVSRDFRYGAAAINENGPEL
jgi:hypothetical protein